MIAKLTKRHWIIGGVIIIYTAKAIIYLTIGAVAWNWITDYFR